MPQRLRVTLLSMVLAAAFLIGGASQCQAAAAGRGTAAALTAPGWTSAVWAAVRLHLPSLISNYENHFGESQQVRRPPARQGRFLADVGVGSNPDGSCGSH